jgi:hypothetical protein
MRILYICLSIILLTTIRLEAQTHLSPLPEAENHIVKFYPNPAISQITFDIQNPAEKMYTIQIFSFLGRKVLQIQSVEQKSTVNLSDFYRGIYIFELKDPSGKVLESGKFQVNK